MHKDDKRTVLTLDAGGTNFVFSAIRGSEEIVEPIVQCANAHELNLCLEGIVKGFAKVVSQLDEPAVAISFAFPGPADYKNGVIGRLPNLPAFSEVEVALGPYLEEKFKLPVFINNDGSLFAYGEALCGVLPQINKELENAGSKRRYNNLLGVTLGTGFGGGVVIEGRLLTGDNSKGGYVWVFRDKNHRDIIADESVSSRAVIRRYYELSGDTSLKYTPLDIFNIAEGNIPGDREAAVRSFWEMGEVAGDVIAQANTIVDGIVVIGGGLTGASKYYTDSLMGEVNSTIGSFGEARFARSQGTVYNLDDPEEFNKFISAGSEETITIPGTDRRIRYQKNKCSGIITSRLGASKAIALGAYAYALDMLARK